MRSNGPISDWTGLDLTSQVCGFFTGRYSWPTCRSEDERPAVSLLACYFRAVSRLLLSAQGARDLRRRTAHSPSSVCDVTPPRSS